ncbi:hypothetical protein Bca52824_014777 [Brassica carinata]|uniref:Uncharacterized protein n=1 Tax=Brassica carinata TaxID=52824 RepID=A0A8X8B2M4_BRACI|nr:hypothetical protein Bca52824_014777 [Brassica carinata]
MVTKKPSRRDAYEYISTIKDDRTLYGTPRPALGFTKFLPEAEGSKITLGSDQTQPKKPEFHHALDFVRKVKATLQDDRAYMSFITILKMHIDGKSCLTEVYHEVCEVLLRDHPDLHEEFAFFLPSYYREGFHRLKQNYQNRCSVVVADALRGLLTSPVLHLLSQAPSWSPSNNLDVFAILRVSLVSRGRSGAAPPALDLGLPPRVSLQCRHLSLVRKSAPRGVTGFDFNGAFLSLHRSGLPGPPCRSLRDLRELVAFSNIVKLSHILRALQKHLFSINRREWYRRRPSSQGGEEAPHKLIGCIVYTIKLSSRKEPVPKIELASMNFRVLNITNTRLSAKWDLSIRIPYDLPGCYICLQGDFKLPSFTRIYIDLNYSQPQVLRVSAGVSIEVLIGKDITEDMKEKKEEKTTGTMRYACDKVTLRFEPGFGMKAALFGKNPSCVYY